MTRCTAPSQAAVAHMKSRLCLHLDLPKLDPPTLFGTAPALYAVHSHVHQAGASGGAYSQREMFLRGQEEETSLSFQYVLNDGDPHNSIWCAPSELRLPFYEAQSCDADAMDQAQFEAAAVNAFVSHL